MSAASHIAEMRVQAKNFDRSQYVRGKKHSLLLDLGRYASGIELPVLLARGEKEGKTLVVTGGVHGDEFEGVRAILEVWADLDPLKMSGDLLAVPVANPLAFWKGTRTTPLDEGNLARTLPGLEQGSPTQVIAFHLANSIIAQGDFYLDLHSAGVKLLMPSMVGYDAGDPRSHVAALAFGASVIWGHPKISPGRTISFAAARRIPWLYTEAAGGGRIDAADLAMFKRGIGNLLRHLKIEPGAIERREPSHSLYGDGDVDASISASLPGFLVPSVQLLDTVSMGQELGRTLDLHGQSVEVFKSPRDGVVGMIHVFPVVQSGDSVFLITGSAK